MVEKHLPFAAREALRGPAIRCRQVPKRVNSLGDELLCRLTFQLNGELFDADGRLANHEVDVIRQDGTSPDGQPGAFEVVRKPSAHRSGLKSVELDGRILE